MKNIFTLLALSALILFGCKKDDPDPNNNNNNNNTGDGILNLTFTKLPDLGGNAKYEGWLIVDGQPNSTGKFTVTNGIASKTEFTVANSILSKAATFVLTIEPEPDNDAGPSDTKLLAGDFNNTSVSNLTAIHSAALNNDFTTAKGNYILATPTTNDANDEFSGIWFVEYDTVNNLESQGLVLPALPAGWQYEGWATPKNSAISTGKIPNPGQADAGNPYSGTDAPGPDFPGEDYVQNPPPGMTFPAESDLRGRTAFITIEPVPDNRPSEPFILKPLNVVISQNATTLTNYAMSPSFSQNVPTGKATRP